MTNKKTDTNDQIRLVDENDPSLTFLNTHVEGHDGEKGTEYHNDAQKGTHYDEETANEFPADGRYTDTEWDEAKENNDSPGKGLGTLAIVLSITSLFLVPLLLGPAGIICGALAAKKGAKALGIWSVVICAVSVAGTLIFSPFL